MDKEQSIKITVKTVVNVPLEQVWEYWNNPSHVTNWNFASEDWHSPIGQNDLREGGKFTYRMEAKDGSVGFDFFGEYEKVVPYQEISYVLGDEREVNVHFDHQDTSTVIIETFDAETENSIELQQQGWQAILNHFKSYAEKTYQNEKANEKE